jgi:hypothetical protein
VASLSRYTQLLNPAFAKPAIAFGESDKARLAAEAVFNIANQCVSCLLHHMADDCCVCLPPGIEHGSARFTICLMLVTADPTCTCEAQ